jgi:anti-anti-sigma factor
LQTTTAATGYVISFAGHLLMISLPNAFSGAENMVAQTRRNWLEIEQIGEAVVAKFTTKKIVGEEKIQGISGQLLHLGNEALRGPLVLSFDRVERLSSEMVGKLLTLQRQIQARGGRLVLCAIKPQVNEIFKILRLGPFFTVYADEQEALQKV